MCGTFESAQHIERVEFDHKERFNWKLNWRLRRSWRVQFSSDCSSATWSCQLRLNLHRFDLSRICCTKSRTTDPQQTGPVEWDFTVWFADVRQGGAERQHTDTPKQQLPDLPSGSHGPLQVRHVTWFRSIGLMLNVPAKDTKHVILETLL